MSVSKHVVSLLLENESGALSRVAGLFSMRGYNIESLTVAPTHDPTLSRATIVTSGDDRTIEQITKQLNKLVDVVRLVDLTEAAHVAHEMMMIKVRASGVQRDEIQRLSGIYKGKIVDVTESTFIIELTGNSDKLDAFIKSVGDEQILEVVRSGVTGIARGERGLKV